MKAFLSFVLILSGCASTTFYGPSGKKTASLQGDYENVQLEMPGMKFSAAKMIHSTATRAGGEAAAKVIGSVGTASVGIGTAIAGSGLVKVK